MRRAQKYVVRYQTEGVPYASLEDLVAALKKHRKIDNDRALELSLKHLLPFQTLKGINEAGTLLADSIRQQKKICIIGDFDTDGATSTALAIKTLHSFGAQHVTYLVPNRFKFGYGLTPEIVDVAYHQFQPDLIITVDNGIASIEGVDCAKQHGMQVLITDHHLPAKILPKADAIVNPNQPGDNFPSKNLAGVGVVFYLMMSTRAILRATNWFETSSVSEPNLAQFLDLVALGTFADVVPLDHNNRILVNQGLLRIRSGQCSAGISALSKFCKRPQAKLLASDLGFIIAPRLNAAGRLEDMSLGIECLLTDDEDRAQALAQQLDFLNQERRAIEVDMQQDAYLALQKLSIDNQRLPHGLCLFQEHWHQGVTGIIASRVKDRYARPTIAFAKINDEELKGSGRSVPGIHIRDILEQIAVENPGLLTRFGGHAMAAGVSLPIHAFDDFSRAFNHILAELLGDTPPYTLLHSDGELTASTLNISVANAIQNLGPYGQAFPEPLFDGIFEVIDQRLVGGRHLKLIVKPKESDQFLDAIVFNVETEEWPKYQVQRLSLAYRLDVNEFQNKRKIQLIVEHITEC